MTPITVHPIAGPMPVAPCPDTPEVREEIKAEWQRQASVSLAKIMQNPMPKGGMK